MHPLIEKAVSLKQTSIGEYTAKQILKDIVPVPEEYLCGSLEETLSRARKISYPVVLKGYSDELAHKTEYGIVHVNIADESALKAAFDSIYASGAPVEGVLIQQMVKGNFELVMGLTRDANFGPAVMLGLGGIYTELFKDITFRVAPLTVDDAREMIDELTIAPVFKGYRKMQGIDINSLACSLAALGEFALANPAVKEIDINPLIISGGRAVAVDALIILDC